MLEVVCVWISRGMVITLIVFVVACWIFDLRSRRVPNWLTAAAALAGFAMNFGLFGCAGLINGLLGAAVGLIALLGPFALGGVGGGDVKMMGAVGAILGPLPTAFAVITGFVIGGLMTVVQLAYLGRLGEILGRLVRMTTTSLLRRSLAPLRVSADAPDAVSFPYTLPLGLGTITAVALSKGVFS